MALREIREQQTMPVVDSSNGSENDATSSPAPRLGVKLMIAILVGLVLVAVYANVQKARRDKIERVIVTPASTATPTAASPVP
jgi:hypothetical protein